MALNWASVCWLALPIASVLAGCSRADLYPVTREHLDDSTTAGGVTATSTEAGNTSSATAATGGEPTSCPEFEQEPGDSVHTVLVDGMTRTYLLHIPPSYDGLNRVPLVVDFHGVGESGTSQRSSSPYPALLDAEGVVMAFPDGLRGPAGSAWNVGPCCVADVDDVAFTRALVADVQASACIDSSQVYAVGVLTGGGMAHYVACHAADVFAAVAPAAFDLLAENVDGCNPSRPITVISFRGTGESRVPYEGGPSALVPGMPLTFLGAEATFEAWSTINGCVGPRSAPDANGCSAYSGCSGGTEVILCTKQGGREEPGDPSIAWPVLKRHRL